MPVRRVFAAALGAFVAVAGALGACGDDTVEPPPGGIDSGGIEGGDETLPGDAGVDAPVRAKFGLDSRPTNATCKAPARPPVAGPVKLELQFPNVVFDEAPLALAQPPGDKSRWFVALRDGRIVVVPTTSPPDNPTVVANIGTLSGLPVTQAGEGGLLGLAFHPKFATNGQLFVSFTTTGGTLDMRSVVGRITTVNGGASFGSYTTILGPFDQPYTLVHKGGTLAFGLDGFLYASFGDGGGYTPAQDRASFLGKLLRLDVDNPGGGKPYGIPPGNPFASTPGAAPEVFAYGFRNPFRFSIDRATGDVWVGDVGELDYEEIDIAKPGGNYGWPCREGAHDFGDGAYCPDGGGGASLTDPIYEYKRTGITASILGGFVYRGSAIPSLQGTYVFADTYFRQAWTLAFDPTTGAPTRTDVAPDAYFVGWAEDQDGELFVTTLENRIYKLVPNGAAPPSTFPDLLSKTGCVDPADAKKPASGLVPYDVRSPLWSDGAEKSRFIALPDGKTITVGADGDFDLPIGSVLVKTFAVGGKRIETRLFVHHDDGEWAGYTYEWNDAETDATLLPAGKTKKVGAQTWTFPSRSDCTSCHTKAAGRTLGLELGQQNGDFVYPSTNRLANQLETLDHIGMFSAPLGKAPTDIVAYPTPTVTASGSVEARARAYLHANCSNCHRPGGPGRGAMDVRFATPFATAKLCNEAPQVGDLGFAGAKRPVPATPAKSLVSLRPHALGAARMPPVASTVVDSAGLGVLDGWIASLAVCP